MMNSQVAIAMVVLGSTCLALGTDTELPTDLAQWNGGSLTRADFVATSDPDETLLRTGGPDMIKAVCKASYRAIYGNEAVKKGFDHDAEFLEEMDFWSTRRLASLYIERSQPSLEPSTDQARKSYTERLAELYTSNEAADLEILFVRCGDENGDECRERLDAYRTRIDSGEDFTALIEEEKARSGEANGVFSKVPLDRLAPELAEAVRTTPDGWLTPVVETPRGLFLIRARNFVAGSAIPFEQAEPHVRQLMRQEAEAAWLESEAARLRAEFGEVIAADADDQEVFAAAARRANLHLEAVFLQAEREHQAWALADFAFFRDAEILPSDEEIIRRLDEEPSIREQYEEHDFLLLVVPATSDRTLTLDAADSVAASLRESETPAAGAASLIAENETLVSLKIEGVTRRQLRTTKRSLVEKVCDLRPGEWAGPFPFRKPFHVPADQVAGGVEGEVPAGVGFVVMRSIRLPTIEALRQAFFRQRRDTIASVETFLDAAAQRWDFKLLVEVPK